MHTHGFHLFLDVWLREDVTPALVDRLSDYIRNRLTVVAEVEKAFEPHGLTRVLVLSESHFAVHTYPEHRYLSIDLYICNPEIRLDLIRDELLALMRVDHFETSRHRRGVKTRPLQPRISTEAPGGAARKPEAQT